MEMDADQTDEYREPCAQCTAVDWGISDEGRFYCKSCHNVIDRMEQVVDTSFMGSNSRVTTIHKRRKSQSEMGCRWMVCEGFQFILRSQAQALLALGVSPHFKDEVLLQMWRLYLQKSHLAYTDNPVRTSTFMVAAAESGMDTEGESSDPSGVTGSTSGNSSSGAQSTCSGTEDAFSYLTPCQRKCRGPMSLPRTLALLHLALVWTREALTLADLLRLVREGHVPYANAYQSFPAQMRLVGSDALIFRVESFPSHSSLHKEAQVVAKLLELPCFPPITPDCLLHPSGLTMRYMVELNLPDELHAWVSQVLVLVGMVGEERLTFDPSLPASPLPPYDVQAAAVVVVTMKLLFGLDDHTEWELSNAAGDADKKFPDRKHFNMRRWYKLLSTALSSARQRQQAYLARQQWKPQKPINRPRKRGYNVIRKRRLVDQLQSSFQKLSGSAPLESPAPSSFLFRWGEGGEGPNMHHHTLRGGAVLEDHTTTLGSTQYWHPVLKRCNPRYCRRSSYEEVQTCLPRSYVWLLEAFSFLLGVGPACLHQQVLELERRLLKKAPQARKGPRGARKHRGTSRCWSWSAGS